MTLNQSRRSPSRPSGRSGLSHDLATVDIREHDGLTVVSLSGEIDLSNAHGIARNLFELPNRAPGMVVDMSEVSYMDSTGISLLYDLSLRLRQRSQLLVVVCPPVSVPRRALELTGLHSQIPVLDQLGTAIAELRDATQERPEPPI